MNILMPMAGNGFRLKGYGEVPKPLVKVNDHSMFLWSLQNIPTYHNFIFIVKDEHIRDYKIDEEIKVNYPNATVLSQYEKLDGAVPSTLIATELINTEQPLLIVDCDIFVDVDYDTMFYFSEADAALVSFKSSSPNYSYANVKDSFVDKVAEKEVISDNALAGVYFWQKGSDYVKYANQMIEKNIKTNNEFYVAPVFNEAIKDGKKVALVETSTFYHLGTKEEISVFIEGYN